MEGLGCKIHAISALPSAHTAAPKRNKLSAGAAGVFFIFIGPWACGRPSFALPVSQGFVTDNRIYQSKTIPEEWGETGISAAAPALEVLRWPQHKDALDAPSVKMSEVPGVAGQ